MMLHILLVKNDPLLRHSLAFNLTQSGYRTSEAGSVEDALNIVQGDQADLILLDVDLTETDDEPALRRFMTQVQVPLIFLLEREQNLDMIMGTETQQHRSMVKPFELDTLLDQIKTLLQPVQSLDHAAAEASVRPVVVGDLTIDPASQTVIIGDQVLELSSREFALLHALARNAGQVLSVEELLATVWGSSYDAGGIQVVYVHIRWLREKLEVDPYHPRRIITVRGVGYKLLAQSPV